MEWEITYKPVREEEVAIVEAETEDEAFNNWINDENIVQRNITIYGEDELNITKI